MKQLQRVLYNTAWFWKVSPLDIRKAPISRVIEMANEACRIAEDLRQQEKMRNGR
nr:MAG TPA: hypothetical protein [Caudoviricetes sp.]